MPIKDRLLQILCCPLTKKMVRVLTETELEQINYHIIDLPTASTKFRRVDGEIVNQPLEEGLVTTDEKTIYRIKDNIPNMIPEQGILVPNDFQFSNVE